MPTCDINFSAFGGVRCDRQATVSYRAPGEDVEKFPRPGYRCDEHRRWLARETIIQELYPKKEVQS